MSCSGRTVYARGTKATDGKPIVPDFDRFPTGRDLSDTRGEIGLAGHWTKLMLHHLFIHKAKARFGWQFIPE